MAAPDGLIVCLNAEAGGNPLHHIGLADLLKNGEEAGVLKEILLTQDPSFSLDPEVCSSAIHGTLEHVESQSQARGEAHQQDDQPQVF